MNLNYSTISLATICEGCLSVGRQLTTIKEDESKTFLQILDSLNHISHAIQLCWECTALLRKTLKFIEQVKSARDSLVNYMVQQSSLTSLSRLRVVKNDVVHYTSHSDARESGARAKNKFIESVDNNVNLEVNVEVSRLTEDSKLKIDTEPLTFIKIEGRDDYDDLQELYVDENLDDCHQTDARLEGVLKSDNEDPTRKRKDRRESIVYHFDASDDEPLKKKAEDKSKKPRGRRKKRERTEKKDKDKIDLRKHPRPKRERAAGVVSNSRVNKKLEQLNVPSGQLEMVILTWEEVEEERIKALKSETFTRHDHRCYDCAIGFNHRVKLDKHMAKHDPSAGELECSICRIRCRDAHALCAHRRRHRVRWRCCVCGGAWSRAAVAADHLARLHRAARPHHACPTCGHTEQTLSKLRNHLKNHAERQKCELCGKTFRDRTSLRTHLFIHKGEKEYACPRCDKRFLFKKAMEVHMVTHDASAQLYCLQCDMNFKNRMSYYQHMKYNLKHVDPAMLKYACTLCDKKFVKATRLREHHVAVHLKATPVHCSLPGCAFACSSRPVLRTHIRMVHRNVRAVRNHVCDTCGKAYTTKKALEGHMHTHTGARPFRCEHCPSTFGYSAALYNHNKLVHLNKQNSRTRPMPPTSLPTQLTIPTQPALSWATIPPPSQHQQLPDIT